MKHPYRWHILICTGENCTAGGSDAIARSFASKLRVVNLQAQLAMKQAQASGVPPDPGLILKLELWQQVKITRVGCLKECDDGPMVVVYPGGAWYARLTPEQIELVIQEHLLGGRPVTALLYHLLPTAPIRTPEPVCEKPIWEIARSA